MFPKFSFWLSQIPGTMDVITQKRGLQVTILANSRSTVESTGWTVKRHTCHTYIRLKVQLSPYQDTNITTLTIKKSHPSTRIIKPCAMRTGSHSLCFCHRVEKSTWFLATLKNVICQDKISSRWYYLLQMLTSSGSMAPTRLLLAREKGPLISLSFKSSRYSYLEAFSNALKFPIFAGHRN